MSENGAYDRVLTQRLELRPVVHEDLGDLYALNSDPEVWRHLPDGRHADPSVTGTWIARAVVHREATGAGYWTARLRATGAFVGVGGAQLQRPGFWNLYYRLARAHWGHGYATEIARAALRAAAIRDPDLPVIAWIHAHNAGSRAVAGRLGLHDHGLLPDPWDGRPLHAYADRDPAPALAGTVSPRPSCGSGPAPSPGGAPGGAARR